MRLDKNSFNKIPKTKKIFSKAILNNLISAENLFYNLIEI